eukprot:3006382-Alexandrium_andersonii.AAC.1
MAAPPRAGSTCVLPAATRTKAWSTAQDSEHCISLNSVYHPGRTVVPCSPRAHLLACQLEFYGGEPAL